MGILRRFREWREDKNGVLTGPDIDADSINTDNVFNNDIGDGVDYSDPRWLVNADTFWFQSLFESVDNYSQTTSGSGSISTPGEAQVRAETGTTSGSTAQIEKPYSSAKITDLSFDRDLVAKIGTRNIDGDTDVIARWGFGNRSGNLSSVGGKIETVSGTPTLRGFVHDGNSETTVDLQTDPGTFVDETLKITFTAGSDVVFDWLGNTGTISSGLPSGGASSVIWQMFVENTASVNRRIDCAEYKVVNKP